MKKKMKIQNEYQSKECADIRFFLTYSFVTLELKVKDLCKK